jgi:hypothetical protein
MDEKPQEHLARRLNEITPAMVNDLYTSYLNDPQLLEKYGNHSLRSMAEQSMVSFRDIMLGALEFNAPSLVTHELSWLDRLLESRHLDHGRIHLFLEIFRQRVRSDLAPEEYTPVIKLLDASEKYLDEKLKATEKEPK